MAVTKIILLSLDNLRYDCMGYQPDKRQLAAFGVLDKLQTPNLDRVAQESLCFTNCISTSTYTTNAHASFLTGLWPPRHGVRAFFHTRLSCQVRSLVELARDAGYRTILATDIPELFEPVGLTRGFDHLVVRDDLEVRRLLWEFRAEKSLLLWHFFDVHEPYLFSECPPDPTYNDIYVQTMASLLNLSESAVAHRPHNMWQHTWNAVGRPVTALLPLYVYGVSRFDQNRFCLAVDALQDAGWWDDACTVVFSDHGEGRCFIDQPEYFSHGGELYDNVLRTVLMLRHPHVRPGLDDRPASLVDVLPTILALMDLPKPPYELDGCSLLDSTYRKWNYAECHFALKGGNLGSDVRGRPVVPHITTRDNQWLLRQRCLRYGGRRKVVLVGRPEDLKDPARFSPDPEQFVVDLYRKLLARFEDEPGLQHYLRALREMGLSRDQVLQAFLSSPEYRGRPRFFAYDLLEDPFEDRPLPAGGAELFSFVETAGALQVFRTLEEQAVEAEPIFPQASADVRDGSRGEEQINEEAVIERLRQFGYVD